MTFPIKVHLTKAAIEEFRFSESCSWTDAGEPKEGHVYNILGRYKTVIEIRDIHELIAVWWALCSGVFQGAFVRSARRMAEELRPYYLELKDSEELDETERWRMDHSTYPSFTNWD